MLVGASFPATAQWYQGPSGGAGGYDFDEWMDGRQGQISSIGILEEDGPIKCLRINVTPKSDKNLSYGSCPWWNAQAQPESGLKMFHLADDEYILGVAGGYDDHINSIRFWTNKRASPRYGELRGKYSFGYTAPSGQMIVAFIGRSGENLDAIGVMYAPCDPAKYSCK
jgi:hypothetical protein